MSDINEKSNFVFEFQPVTKLFEEQVRLHPDKCAVASSTRLKLKKPHTWMVRTSFKYLVVLSCRLSHPV